MGKRICILGATGSIGENCLAVVERLGEPFEVVSLAAHRKSDKLLELAGRCGARRIGLADCAAAGELAGRGLGGLELGCGQNFLVDLSRDPDVDIVVNAMVGSAGLPASIAALESGKRLALANKESLVMAGDHLMRLARGVTGAEIIPVDSEHSAIFQLLEGRDGPGGGLDHIVITASGGPFRRKSREQLREVSFSDSLNHPTWDMGPKITVDSASLANKGLEVIEAHFLFGLGYDSIRVLVHPQSIVHGMAVFSDGAVMGHMGQPDMKMPIQYALTYPERLDSGIEKPDFPDLGKLVFEEVDRERFPCLGLAYEAGRMGGVATAVYNAANEVAVEFFSTDRIGFMRIPETIERTLVRAPKAENPGLEEIFEADSWARGFARGLLT